MSTQNSSVYARKHQHSDDHPSPPQVPFCIACKNPATQLPHHGLCPKHADFFNSGSYEILNLVVDGNILKCEACSYHFDNGRPNKQLEHIDGCEKGKKKKGTDKCGSNPGAKAVSSKDATVSGCKKQSSQNNKVCVSLEEAAGLGCKKCQRELASGIKENTMHDDECPRKLKKPQRTQRSYHTVSLEEAAGLGCKKCQRELASGKKDRTLHDDGCPRKAKARVVDKTRTNEDEESAKAIPPLKNAATKCKKCQRELATGLTSSFQHSADCPLKESNKPDESSSPSCSNKSDKSPKFDVGTLVFVKSRTWPGMNKLGGVARVTKVHVANNVLDCVKYDVSYVIETRREKMIEEKFVSLHTEYVSPSKDQSLVHIADELDSTASDDEQYNDGGEFFVLSSAEKKDADGNPLSDCKFPSSLQYSCIHIFSQIFTR
jgi:hypothetical protein